MDSSFGPGVFGIVGAGLAAQNQRLSLIASNLANADSETTPDGTPFRAVEPVFAAVPDEQDGGTAVRVLGTVQSDAPAALKYDPGSPYANAQGYVQGSNVSTTDQMVDLIDATQNYSDQIALLDQSQKLESSMIQSFVP